MYLPNIHEEVLGLILVPRRKKEKEKKIRMSTSGSGCGGSSGSWSSGRAISSGTKVTESWQALHSLP